MAIIIFSIFLTTWVKHPLMEENRTNIATMWVILRYKIFRCVYVLSPFKIGKVLWNNPNAQDIRSTSEKQTITNFCVSKKKKKTNCSIAVRYQKFSPLTVRPCIGVELKRGVKQMRRWSTEEAMWSWTIELIHKREIGTKKEIQLNADSVGMKETKRVCSEYEVGHRGNKGILTERPESWKVDSYRQWSVLTVYVNRK